MSEKVNVMRRCTAVHLYSVQRGANKLSTTELISRRDVEFRKQIVLYTFPAPHMGVALPNERPRECKR